MRGTNALQTLLAARLHAAAAALDASSSSSSVSSAYGSTLRVLSTLQSLSAFNTPPGQQRAPMPSTLAPFDSTALPARTCIDGRRQFFRLPGDDSGLRKKHNERRLLGWSPQQLYDVVADVDQYAKFVPWCQSSCVLLRRGEYMEAELEVGFKVFVERYTSHITLRPAHSVHSEVRDSTLFDHLTSTWEFAPGPTPGSCWLSFRVDFEFKSPLYRQVAALFFEEVVQRMMGAFQERCQEVYGAPSIKRKGAAGGAQQPVNA